MPWRPSGDRDKVGPRNSHGGHKKIYRDTKVTSIMEYDLIIKNGLVTTASDVAQYDIAIKVSRGLVVN